MVKAAQNTILIIDDTASYRRILRRIVENIGYPVVEAADGHTALEIIQACQPMLILLDVKMPGIDGFETCRRLKANPETETIPVIFMTSLTEMSHKLRGLKVGGIDYITKPFQAEEVLYRIQIHLKLRQMSEELIAQNQQLQIEIKAKTEAQEALLKLNQNLEALVDERTQKLTAALNELQNKEKEFAYMAYYDSLTNLPNRYWFLYQFEKLIQSYQHRPSPPPYAVLFIDLDRFKVINNSLGHTIGDELLKATAKRLKKFLPPNTTLARLGGDEFIVLLESFEHDEWVLSLTQAIITELKKPFKISFYELQISASVGVVFSHSDYEDAITMLRDADVALYRAKSLGKCTFVVLDEILRNQSLERLHLETDLRDAIHKNQLTLHYQPIIDLQQLQLAGFEALVRWHHPSNGLIPPDLFIPIAEETGLINSINEYVLTAACKQLEIWHEDYDKPHLLFVNVNLSLSSLFQNTITEKIDLFLSQNLFPKSCLKIEITESGLSEDYLNILEMLQEINARGIHLCIDDFGTGHSSLSRLHSMPISTLKIDKSFIDKVHLDDEGLTFVQTIIALAKGLNINTVAEGVESEEQLALLKELGCDYAQGYYFNKPLDVDTATHLIRTELDKQARVPLTSLLVAQNH